jgi:RNA polymerase sigma-B factor
MNVVETICHGQREFQRSWPMTASRQLQQHPSVDPVGRSLSPHDARVDRAGATAQLLVRAAATTDELEQRRLRDEAVALNLGVARAVASRYRNRGLAYEDLVQVACVGLVKAVRGFDPSREHDFLAYAVPTVAGEVKRHFRDHGWTVRPPRSMQELRAAVSDVSAKLTQELGRSPRSDEVAESLAVDVERVIEAVVAGGCFVPVSLDVPVGEERLETLADRFGVDDPEIGRAEARIVLAPLVRTLKSRDREILELRFFDGLTQQEIGDRIGVSQMQVSRLLTRILGQLRRELAGTPSPLDESGATG